MATITPRGPYRFEVQIRRKGYPSQTKTFSTREEAELWAMETELAMRRGTWVCRKEGETTTVAEALERYAREITPKKRGAPHEKYRVNRLKAEPVFQRPLAALHGGDLAKWRNDRLKRYSPSTVRRDLTIISHLYTVARKEWGMPYLENPVGAIRLPSEAEGRDRRLEPGEDARLLAAARDIHPDLEALIVVAIETGMRRAEMTGARWEWVRGAVLRLPITKNGTARDVPLSSRALGALSALPKRLDGRIFGISADWASRAFLAACRAAEIEGLRLHDLRHEATSRFFEKGLNVMEVAAITGHKTLGMLRRYTQLRAEDLARKLG